MKKFDYKKIGFGLIAIFTVSAVFLFCLQKDRDKHYDDQRQKKFVSDLRIFNDEFQNGQYGNIKQRTKYLVDEYYEWAKNESADNKNKMSSDEYEKYKYSEAEITGCVGLSDCGQYKIVKFDIGKEELSSFMKRNNKNSVEMRYRILASMKNDYPLVKSKEIRAEASRSNGKITEKDEIRIHQIRILEIIEMLDIK